MNKELTVPEIEEKELFCKKTVENLVEKAENYEVTTVESSKEALSMAMQARKLSTTIENSRKDIVRPHLDFQRSVKKFADDLRANLIKIETDLTTKIEKFQGEREKRLLKKGVYTDLDLDVEDGTQFVRETIEIKIEDITKVPKEFLMVDETAIKAAVKQGLRKIPGVKVLIEKKKTYRVKN